MSRSTSPASDDDDMAWCDVTSMVDCFVVGHLEGSVFVWEAIHFVFLVWVMKVTVIEKVGFLND